MLDEGKPSDAVRRAQSAMLGAADALTRELHPELGHEPAAILSRFRSSLADSGAFDAASPGGRFAHFVFRAHGLDASATTAQGAHELIEEAQLFVDASYQYNVRKQTTPST